MSRAARRLGRLRLATGLVLFAFLTTHFANHALGLVSLQAMEQGRELFLALWRNPPATLLLYGSLICHFGLALWSLYRRRSLRMPVWEAAQLLFGLAIPPLVILHIVGNRGAHELFGTQDSYALALYVLWVADPANTVRQVAVFTVAWIHGCIGLHFWLRLKPAYGRLLPFAYATAMLLPSLGLLGFIEGGREVGMLAQQPGWLEAVAAANRRPDAEQLGRLYGIADWLEVTYWVLLGATLLARAIRQAATARRAVTVTYPPGRRVAVAPGTTLLEASRIGGIPHASVCGGRGRCSTCRTRIAEGIALLPPPNALEQAVLERIAAPPDVRLACQTRPTAGVTVFPLLPPAGAIAVARGRRAMQQGREREVAVLFADIRGFTRVAEGKLPYDVVFLLNRYFTAMGRAVEAADGRLDKFVGDGVMAIFGIARPPDDACRRALTAARNMAVNLAELNESLAEERLELLHIGIGIHAGPAIVGEMGYGDAVSVTAIGDTVNIASRLEALTKDYDCQLVLSEAVLHHAGVALPEAGRRETPIRGRSGKLAVRILADARDLPERIAESPQGEAT